MYRLVLYYLLVLLGVAFILGFFGIIPYTPETLLFSTVIITGVCWITNTAFAKVFNAVPNTESIYITALILALIVTPVASTDLAGVGFLVFISVWAMASKYIFAIGKKHIFNPAAFAIALSAVLINQPASWWVAGNVALLPFVVAGGLLIVRKIQRFDLVISFGVVAIATTLLTYTGASYTTPLSQTLLHSSFFFLAFVMLTEPLTTPPGKIMRICYGAIVGLLFAPAVHIGSFYLTPEIALLVGNVFAYIASPKGRFMLTLTSKEEVGQDMYDFVFTADRKLMFVPGQYLEWTLAHRFPDDRGNRRYFTIASSPTEHEIRLGVKFYPKPSSYKRALLQLEVGDTVSVSALSGEFVLPKKKKQGVVFIAGGIGITPFRSMIKYMADTRDTRNAILLYSNRTINEIAYKDVFDEAYEKIGIKTLYAVTAEKKTHMPHIYNGRLTAALIRDNIPHYHKYVFYISGPRNMVTGFEKSLREAGVPKKRIKVDFFPGFA
jgi:glycine betaine catabolism B